MLRKLCAYIKYYMLKANMRFDRIKEPWRMIIGVSLIAPCWWGLTSDSFAVRYLAIVYLLAVVGLRTYWDFWLKKNMGE